jgi:hypothetical protein
MNKVAGVQRLQLRDPRPCGVVGLAAGVVQLERQPALGEREVVAVGDVGVAIVVGPRELVDRQGELTLVDGGVPPERALVPAEVVGELLVRVHDGRRPTPLGGLGLEARGAEDVVDVVVAVDGGPHWRIGTPPPHLAEDVVDVELPARVEHRQAVAGVDGVDRGHRDHRQDAGRDLLRRPAQHRADRVVGVDQVALTVPVLLGELPDRCRGPHAASVGRRRQPAVSWRARRWRAP